MGIKELKERLKQRQGAKRAKELERLAQKEKVATQQAKEREVLNTARVRLAKAQKRLDKAKTRVIIVKKPGTSATANIIGAAKKVNSAIDRALGIAPKKRVRKTSPKKRKGRVFKTKVRGGKLLSRRRLSSRSK